MYIVTLLINLYSEYILQSDELDESQAGIKIARRNINSLRYAGDTTLKAESEEELRSLWMTPRHGARPGSEAAFATPD